MSTTTTTTTTTTHNSTRHRFFEESYVDAIEGRRSLADVMGQFDGLESSSYRRNRNRQTSRRPPMKRSEVSLMNKDSIGAETEEANLPVRQRAHIPCAKYLISLQS
jgi:hypothetical protein